MAGWRIFYLEDFYGFPPEGSHPHLVPRISLGSLFSLPIAVRPSADILNPRTLFATKKLYARGLGEKIHDCGLRGIRLLRVLRRQSLPKVIAQRHLVLFAGKQRR